MMSYSRWDHQDLDSLALPRVTTPPFICDDSGGYVIKCPLQPSFHPNEVTHNNFELLDLFLSLPKCSL